MSGNSQMVANPPFLLALALSILAFIPTLACSRYWDLPATGDASSSLQPPPFGRLADTTGVSPTAPFLPSFLAVGTTLTVRLQTALSSASSHAGDSFEGQLQEPIVLQGETIAPRGTLITGKVSAVSAGLRGFPGYLRLTLTGISLNGKVMTLQTTSVFAKAGPRGKPSPATNKPSEETSKVSFKLPAHQDAEFTPANSLIFRLAQPFWLGG